MLTTLTLFALLNPLAPPPLAVLKSASVVVLTITASIRLWHHGVLGPVEKKIGERS